ncbi:MAG TPA: hypothetical protein VIM55_12330 [Mucilaginibacter sp.]
MGVVVQAAVAAVLANGYECARGDEPGACDDETLAMADDADAAVVAEFASLSA